jgi:S-adenosylhomocysteine hydrolase
MRSSVNPTEVFTETAIKRAVDGITEAGAVVDGYRVRDIDENAPKADVVNIDGSPF